MPVSAKSLLPVMILVHGHTVCAHDIPLPSSRSTCVETASSTFMQIPKQPSLTKLNDADADFTRDANNPLDMIDSSNLAVGDLMRAKPMKLTQDTQEFDCKAGISEWKLGWSSKKKEFCCRTAKVGCTQGMKTTSNGTAKHITSTETKGSVNERSNFTDNSTSNANVTNNTSNVTNVYANVTNNISNVTNVSACITRADPRVSSTYYTTSPVGTPCVFGVDPRDEGSHCIMEGGKYGSFGWCYTSKDKTSWGSCAESCPLFGPLKVLGAKIDKLDSKLDKIGAAAKKVLGDTRQENTSVPTHASKAVGKGKQATNGMDSSNAPKHGDKK